MRFDVKQTGRGGRADSVKKVCIVSHCYYLKIWHDLNVDVTIDGLGNGDCGSFCFES